MEAGVFKETVLIAVLITALFMTITFIITYWISNITSNKTIKNQIEITSMLIENENKKWQKEKYLENLQSIIEKLQKEYLKIAQVVVKKTVINENNFIDYLPIEFATKYPDIFFELFNKIFPIDNNNIIPEKEFGEGLIILRSMIFGKILEIDKEIKSIQT